MDAVLTDACGSPAFWFLIREIFEKFIVYKMNLVRRIKDEMLSIIARPMSRKTARHRWCWWWIARNGHAFVIATGRKSPHIWMSHDFIMHTFTLLIFFCHHKSAICWTHSRPVYCTNSLVFISIIVGTGRRGRGDDESSASCGGKRLERKPRDHKSAATLATQCESVCGVLYGVSAHQIIQFVPVYHHMFPKTRYIHKRTHADI